MISAEQTESIEDCVLCGHSKTRLDWRFGRLLGLISPYAVRQCQECGLKWLSPRPTAEGYGKLYSYESYFDGQDAVESYRDVVEQRLYQFRTRMTTIESMVTGRDSLSILDVGAATGEFLSEAARRGHSVRGVELSDGARTMALQRYGLALEPGPIDDLPSASFDVIHMSHVLEHMPDPRATIRQCHSLLRPHGLLVVEVPQQFDNDLDRLRKLFTPRHRHEFNAYSLHHTYFFSPSTIQALMDKESFSVLRLATANWARTPLRPFSMRNLLLGSFLWVADKLHHGGNIIELYAVRE